MEYDHEGKGAKCGLIANVQTALWMSWQRLIAWHSARGSDAILAMHAIVHWQTIGPLFLDLVRHVLQYEEVTYLCHRPFHRFTDAYRQHQGCG